MAVTNVCLVCKSSLFRECFQLLTKFSLIWKLLFHKVAITYELAPAILSSSCQ